MIYAVIFCILLIGLYLISRTLKRNLLPEIIISFLIGLNWEIYSAHEWVYDHSKLIMINVGIETIPLDVVIAWSVVLSAVILIVYETMKILNRTSKFAFLVIGCLVLFFVGFAIELVGYYGSFWTYTVKSDLYLWPTAIPLRIVIGWITLGTINLATIKFYRGYVEKKIRSAASLL
jgi:hypothetical protein